MRTLTSVSWCAPLVSRKAREISTIFLPLHSSTSLGSFVTTATGVASRFSSAAYCRNFASSSAATTTAMRSWDSAMASSVPSRPSYFFGTKSRLSRRPSASSPLATDTPPAPKSLHFLMIEETSGLLNRRCSFLSVGALPFWTSAPQLVRDCSLWALEDPVAPPMPSRPVRPPSRMMWSPGAEFSRFTFLRAAAPMTAPISMRLAT